MDESLDETREQLIEMLFEFKRSTSELLPSFALDVNYGGTIRMEKGIETMESALHELEDIITKSIDLLEEMRALED